MSQENYLKAKKLGEREVSRRTAADRYPYLPALNEILGEKTPLTPVPLGTMYIPAERIIGTRTAGRQNAFAANYMPILEPSTEFANKWCALYNAQIEEGIREPVKAYEYLGDFYIEEGNKRVSVLKYLEVPTVLAQVYRVMPAHLEENDRTEAYREFLEFFKAAPTYHIMLTHPGGYEKICEAFGESMTERWPEDKLKKLRSSWFQFEEAYRAKMPESEWDKAGDAFVVYLSIYSAASLTTDSSEVLRQRMEKLKKEFAAAGGDTIKVVEEPIPEKGAAGPVSRIKSIVMPEHSYTAENPLSVAFMYRSSREASAWVREHDAARCSLTESFGGTVAASFYENLTDDASLRAAIDDAVSAGAKVIFTVSADLLKETVKSALHYPKVRFLNCSLNASHPSVPTYFPRRYEGKFLLGAIAAICARNHRIGYIADLPIYGTTADINAFAIGASLIDPRARIYLQWAAESGADWRKYFKDNEVLVVCGLDRGPEDQQGLNWTNWEGDRRHLADARIDWAEYYRRIVKSILDGSQKSFEKDNVGQPINFWYGLSSGIVNVTASEELPYHTQKMISLLTAAMKEGTLDPFEGELRSADRLIQSAESPRLPIREIIGMEWLNDNIIGSFPKTEVFPENSKSVISVSGVSPVKS